MREFAKMRKTSVKVLVFLFALVSFLGGNPWASWAGDSDKRRPDKYSSPEEWEKWRSRRRALAKSFGIRAAEDEKMGIHDGNLIRTIFFNFGSIGAPGREPSVEWPQGSEHGYAYEFGPVVAAEVIDMEGVTRHIVSEGLDDGGDTSPEGYRWGWEPLPGYANPDQPSVAMSDKPETWPAPWPDGDWRWPGEFGRGVMVADQESYFKMDDYYNKEFKYYPDSTDSNRGGLGFEVEVRGYQWAHILAEDCIFFTYEIKNVSTTDYEKVIFGMFGDPHPGGANDYNDDDGYFDTLIDMVFAWDHDNVGDWGPGVGYFGYKFLESPGNPYDGIDNDEDGMIDERMDDGIDNDGDWNIVTDDVGADGVGPEDPGYIGPDEGEGDGVPTPGEPNFDGTDLHEADQIGLTGFDVAPYHSYYPYNDEEMWRRMQPGIDTTGWAQTADNVFLYSSGPFPLHVGDIRRFSIALLCGEDFYDLVRNAQTVQRIYNAFYHFVKPPDKPRVRAVAGDGYVTLYWDDRAEYSRDPIYGYDFAGYAIYRATDFRFNEVRTITDSEGNLIAYEPIAKFDVVDKWVGPHPEGINGFHYHMGYNTGLVHSWTDTTVKNGVTYFYAVVAYDTGAASYGATPGVPPAECTKRITEDPLHPGTYIFDENTVMVTPRPFAADYEPPEIVGGEAQHVSGAGTGSVRVNILDPMAVKEGFRYRLTFDDTSYAPSSDTSITFSVECLEEIRESFVSSEMWIRLKNKHLVEGTVTVSDPQTGEVFVEGVDYILNYKIGSIKILNTAAIQVGKSYEISYRYYPIYKSIFLKGEDRNPYFDGLQVLVRQDSLMLDTLNSRWIKGDCNYRREVRVYSTRGIDYPADFEFRFMGSIGDSVRKDARPAVRTHAPFIVYNVTEDKESRFVIIDKDRNGYWNSGDMVVIILGERGLQPSYEVTLTAPDTNAIHPEAGDVFLVRTRKPFTSKDVYEFSTKAASRNPEKAKNLLGKIAVVPNPYVVTNIAEPRTNFITGRGERRLFFIHLPSRCTIRIYTMAGELVKTIEHNSPVDDGQHAWNLLNEDNLEIAFGIYIYHVEAPGIGETIGKFAVIK